MLGDMVMVNIIDMKMIIMADTFASLKAACVESVINYFDGQRDTLVIIFAIFVTFIVFSTFYFLVRAV